MKQLKQRLVGWLYPVGEEYMSLRQMYWRMEGWAPVSVRVGLRQLAAKNLVTQVKRGGAAYYRLTSVGREVTVKLLPALRERREVWDKGWRLVMVAGKIPDRDQRELRLKLQALGLRRVSEGLWVTPGEVTRAVRDLALARGWTGVMVWETRKLVFGDDRALADQIWQVGQLGRKYAQLGEKAGELVREVRSVKKLTEQVKKKVRDRFEEWYRLVSTDPVLPRALLPRDWRGEEVNQTMKRVAASLGELEGEEIGAGHIGGDGEV